MQAADNVATSYKWDDIAESREGITTPAPTVEFDAATGQVKINGTVLQGYTYSKYSDIPADRKQDLDDAISASGVTPLGVNDWAFQDIDGTWHFMYANEMITKSAKRNLHTSVIVS